MTIGIQPDVKTIEQLRARAVLTWGELADRAGISKVTKTNIRQGRAVSVRTIRAVAKALNVEPSAIVHGGSGTAGSRAAGAA